MKLEWDEAKRKFTLDQRGLDFASLARFDWDTAMISDDIRYDYGETRAIAFGFIDNRLVCFVYTIREHALRVISLRNANSRERKIYDHFTEQTSH
jgi:uncharacterized DUF497 family protein